MQNFTLSCYIDVQPFCTSISLLLFNMSFRYSHLTNKCRTLLELFFAIWFVMGNLWVFDSRFGSFQRAPKLHLLCSILLVWNAICYSFPFILFLLLCCCVPLISSLIGYNMNMGSTEKGASDDQISQLPSWRYKAVDSNIKPGNQPDSHTGPPKEDPVSNLSSSNLFFFSYLLFQTTGIKMLLFALHFSGMLHLSCQVQRQRRSETVALFSCVSSKVCR